MKCSAVKLTSCFGFLVVIYGLVLVLTSKHLLEKSTSEFSALVGLEKPLPDCRPAKSEEKGTSGLRASGASNEDVPVEDFPVEDVSDGVELAILDQKRQKPTKYMTFKRNGGRMNNQWFSLVAAIMMSTMMERTLLVPPEMHGHERTGMFEPELGWWDLDSLFETYDIEFVKDPNDPRLTVTDENCVGEHQKMMNNWQDTLTRYGDCPIIDMGGQYGLLQCQQHQFCGHNQRLAFEIYTHFKPGPTIRNVLDKLPPYKVAVHSRTHGGPDRKIADGKTTICFSGLERTAAANLESYNMQEIYGQCNFNETLRYLVPDEPFLLAHDGLLDFDTHYSDRAVTVSKALKDAGVIGEKTGVLAAVIELFSMVRADYFYGMIYSTFALSVCMMRGEEKKYDSNVCWSLMHADTRFAEPPTSDYKRIACMVPFGPTHDIKYYENIHATWGKRCDILRFFPDSTFVAQKNFGTKDDVIFLPMLRKYGDQICGDGKPCRHIWEKMWRIWVWVGDNILDKADYFLKVDTDTFFIPENARDLVKDLLPEDDLYTGHVLYSLGSLRPFVSGIASMYSRGTMRRASHVYRNMPTEGEAFESGKCVDRAGATEELTTRQCLSEIGIFPTPARDSGKEKFLTFNPHAHLNMKKPEKVEGDWFWQKKPPEVGDGVNCCSEKPVAIHPYKRVNDLRWLDNSLYGSKTELEVGAIPGEGAYEGYVLQRDYLQNVQKNVDRTRRVIITSRKLVNAQVFLALCYYMPFDDRVCDPSRASRRQYVTTYEELGENNSFLEMKEAERWAYHRQPWIVEQDSIQGDLTEKFPKNRPYRVVIIDEGRNLGDDMKHRFEGEEAMSVAAGDFLDREKCVGTLRKVFYYWDLPYSREAVLRACRETQAGQMTTKMLAFLGDEAPYISL